MRGGKPMNWEKTAKKILGSAYEWDSDTIEAIADLIMIMEEAGILEEEIEYYVWLAVNSVKGEFGA